MAKLKLYLDTRTTRPDGDGLDLLEREYERLSHLHSQYAARCVHCLNEFCHVSFIVWFLPLSVALPFAFATHVANVRRKM